MDTLARNLDLDVDMLAYEDPMTLNAKQWKTVKSFLPKPKSKFTTSDVTRGLVRAIHKVYADRDAVWRDEKTRDFFIRMLRDVTVREIVRKSNPDTLDEAVAEAMICELLSPKARAEKLEALKWSQHKTNSS